MAPSVPERLRLAVDALELRPDARVLEAGCGTGVAAELLCRRVPDGHVTALDRSASAVAHAERRLRRWADAGVADVVERELRDFHGDGRPYDVVLAVRVNVFWTGPADVEVARLRELVADDGAVHLWFDAPGGQGVDRTGGTVAQVLSDGGFTASVEHREGLVHVTARPA